MNRERAQSHFNDNHVLMVMKMAYTESCIVMVKCVWKSISNLNSNNQRLCCLNKQSERDHFKANCEIHSGDQTTVLQNFPELLK